MATRDATQTARARGILEVFTAVLLGLVSVATALGAYQASQWGQRSAELAAISQQARDRNLSLYLEGELIGGDDFQRVFDVLALHAQSVFYPEREEAQRAEQDVVISAASQPLVDGFDAWRETGFQIDQAPILSPEYEAMTYAPGQSYNVVSTVAYRASEALEDRSYTMTIVSVIFAVALLLLGVAGSSARLAVSAIMAGGGAFAFLAGVAVVILGIF